MRQKLENIKTRDRRTQSGKTLKMEQAVETEPRRNHSFGV